MALPTRSVFRFATVVALVALLVSEAGATWSFVIADRRTKEVGVGTVTCLTSFDLRAIVPVIVVGKGAAACQAAGDFDGRRRPVIFDGLEEGLTPLQILQRLAPIAGHTQRQYGIVDTTGGSRTFTGFEAFPWRGGVTGEVGDLVYAIQGNILAGPCVVPAMEAAIRDTPGDMAEKMMAAHRAARDTGGDGRCSCSQGDPEGCGCPPDPPAKSGHIGCLVVARVGDTDDSICNFRGCADGDYFLSINVAFQTTGAPDPVDQLQALFDDWRFDLVGRPDGIVSTAEFDRSYLVAGRTGSRTLTIDPRDWQGQAIGIDPADVRVEHAPGSAGRTTIGPVVANGDGTLSVTMTLSPAASAVSRGRSGGLDTFRVVLDDGIRPATIAPDPSLDIRRVSALRP